MTRRYSSTAQVTTLAAGCTSAATSIQVTATTGFPAVDFVLALDYGAAGQELVLVTNVSGTTLTVTRGYNSTPASAHSLGAAVAHTHSAQDFTDSRTHEAATTGIHGVAGGLVGTTDTQALSNKDLSSGTNTFPASLATDVEVASAVSTHAGLTATHGATGAVVGTTNAQALSNKTIDLASNTLTGTKAQFNAALSGEDFATLTGAETLTNKTLTAPAITSPVITAGGLSGLTPLVCTSATRPAHVEGQVIYETDTDRLYSSDGANWRPLSINEVGAWRPLVTLLTWTNQTTYGVVPDPTERTALTTTLVKASATSVLSVVLNASCELSSGVAQNLFMGLRIAGTDYDVARYRAPAAVGRVNLSAPRRITGVAAGTLTIEPVFKSAAASVVNAYATDDQISYTVREVPA